MFLTKFTHTAPRLCPGEPSHRTSTTFHWQRQPRSLSQVCLSIPCTYLQEAGFSVNTHEGWDRQTPDRGQGGQDRKSPGGSDRKKDEETTPWHTWRLCMPAPARPPSPSAEELRNLTQLSGEGPGGGLTPRVCSRSSCAPLASIPAP